MNENNLNPQPNINPTPPQAPVTPPVQPAAPQTPPEPQGPVFKTHPSGTEKRKITIMLVAIFVLLIGIGVMAYLLLTKSENNNGSNNQDSSRNEDGAKDIETVVKTFGNLKIDVPKDYKISNAVLTEVGSFPIQTVFRDNNKLLGFGYTYTEGIGGMVAGKSLITEYEFTKKADTNLDGFSVYQMRIAYEMFDDDGNIMNLPEIGTNEVDRSYLLVSSDTDYREQFRENVGRKIDTYLLCDALVSWQCGSFVVDGLTEKYHSYYLGLTFNTGVMEQEDIDTAINIMATLAKK